MKTLSVNSILDSAQYFGVQREIFNSDPLKLKRLNTNHSFRAPNEKLQMKWTAALNLRDQYLERVSSSYDLHFLNDIRLIVVGTGGAASLLRNAARMGVGEFILIDPDSIESPNVGSQDARPGDIGKAKVNAIADDIISLNPAAAVLALQNKIEDLDDEFIEKLVHGFLRFEYAKPSKFGCLPYSPMKTILLILTDNFHAQARGHRLGLQFGLPTICAQEYLEGLGAEVTYTVPGVTPACHRCITASRYKAYLENGYQNEVTSAGAPVFAAEYLNAVLGHMLLAVIHHGTDHPRWGKVVEELGARNLIRLRMDNSFDRIFGDAFGRRTQGAKEEGAFYMMDSLFLAQDPDYGQSPNRPVCPDCGGCGDLHQLSGTFADTREIRREFAQAS